MLISKLPESIQRQDEMTNIIGKSLKKITKKIHNLELMMHNEPTEDAESYEKMIWKEKMDTLLHYEVAKRLPTLKEIQLAKLQEQTLISNKIAARKRRNPKKKPMYQRIVTDDDSAAAVASHDRVKFGGHVAGGRVVMSAPSCDGAVLSVVKNYKGLNTSCGDERTLRRQDGRHSKMTATSSLPKWIGPGYYADSATKNSTERPASSFQISFRNTGRVVPSAEELKAARFEQLSKSSVFSTGEDTRPSYSAASNCSRGHNDMDPTGHFCDNPWSTSSAQSTIGRPSSQSGRQSPQSVRMHSPKKTVCAYESVISDFIGLPGGENSSLNSIGMDDSVNVNTLDSLVLKAADVDKRRYLNSDFAMGGLDLQEEIPVMTLSDFGEVDVKEQPKPVSKKSHQTKGKASDDHPKSKAQKTLNNIKHDLSQNRKSQVRDQDISFTDSLSFIIDDWQSSESVKSPSKKYVNAKHRKNRSQVTPNVVNLDRLLMDDTGMSFEEATSLVEEYSVSLNLPGLKPSFSS